MKKAKYLLLLLFIVILSACDSCPNLIFHEYCDSTCQEEGNEAYYECSSCHKLFSDEHETEIPTIPVIEKKEHSLEKISNNVGHFYTGECVNCGHKEVCEEIPEIRINTITNAEIEGNKDVAEYYPSHVSVTNCETEYQLTDIEADVKVRGNYSANYSKKPYRIKFNSKQIMLGLNDDLKAKNWVLLADYKDRTLFRNMIAFTVGNEITDEYTSDFRYVSVYVNNTYRGLYLLCEQQQVNKGRVNITEPEENYTGTDIGYFVELDSYYTEENPLNQFEMQYYDLQFKDSTTCSASRFQKGYAIKSDIYDITQKNYIQKTMNNIFKIARDSLEVNHSTTAYQALDSNNNIITDSSINSAYEAINRIIDIDSLVNSYLLNEICLDMDIPWSSFYMYYDVQGTKKLTFTAPWDFDSALGYAVGETDILPTSYHYNSSTCRSDTIKNYTNPWLLLFVNEQWFDDLLKQRWEKIKDVKDVLIGNIDFVCEYYGSEISKNFQKWPECRTFTEYLGCTGYEQCKTHTASTEYLKNFITNRFTYLDSVFGQ